MLETTIIRENGVAFNCKNLLAFKEPKLGETREEQHWEQIQLENYVDDDLMNRVRVIYPGCKLPMQFRQVTFVVVRND